MKIIAFLLPLVLAAPAFAQSAADPFKDGPGYAKIHIASGFVCPAAIGPFERDAQGENDVQTGSDLCSYAALDGVYKMAEIAARPVMKLSETTSKLTLPGIKQVRRVLDKDGRFFGADVIVLEGQGGAPVPAMYHPFEPGKTLPVGHLRQESLLELVMEQGEILQPALSLTEHAAYCQRRLGLLPAEYRRFENPHHYKVGLSKRLLGLRDETRARYNQF